MAQDACEDALDPKLGYLHFKRRIHRAAIGVSKGKKTKGPGICAVCKTWDDSRHMRIAKSINKCMTMLPDLCENYFDTLPKAPSQEDPSFNRASSVIYIQTLLGL